MIYIFETGHDTDPLRQAIYLTSHRSIRLSIYPSIYLSVYLSTSLPIYPKPALFTWDWTRHRPPPPSYLSHFPSIYPFIYQSVYLSILNLLCSPETGHDTDPLRQAIYLTSHQSIRLSIYPKPALLPWDRTRHRPPPPSYLSHFLSIYPSTYLH